MNGRRVGIAVLAHGTTVGRQSGAAVSFILSKKKLVVRQNDYRNFLRLTVQLNVNV